jgi:peptide-methionine (S)-S-oxide reductase
VIYTHDAQQIATAKQVIAEMAHVWDGPIVTELLETPVFYRAEEYHQNYFANNPLQSYCVFVVEPKVMKFKKVFGSRLGHD